MKYTPQKMIDTGRYKTCFSELPSGVQQEVLRRMQTLIEENAEWCDKGNYGRLCHHFPKSQT